MKSYSYAERIKVGIEQTKQALFFLKEETYSDSENLMRVTGIQDGSNFRRFMARLTQKISLKGIFFRRLEQKLYSGLSRRTVSPSYSSLMIYFQTISSQASSRAGAYNTTC